MTKEDLIEPTDMEELMALAKTLRKIDALVVEDDEETNESLSNSLGNYFKTVYSALNAKDAIRIFTKKRPQVVFLDVIMPEMNGVELARKLKEKNPDQIIVMVSASDQPEHVYEANKIGVTHFISKPISMEKLTSVLKTIASLKARMRSQISFVTNMAQDDKISASAQQENTTKSAIIYRAVDQFYLSKPISRILHDDRILAAASQRNISPEAVVMEAIDFFLASQNEE